MVIPAKLEAIIAAESDWLSDQTQMESVAHWTYFARAPYLRYSRKLTQQPTGSNSIAT
jgi:hypothetical protein